MNLLFSRKLAAFFAENGFFENSKMADMWRDDCYHSNNS